MKRQAPAGDWTAILQLRGGNTSVHRTVNEPRVTDHAVDLPTGSLLFRRISLALQLAIPAGPASGLATPTGIRYITLFSPWPGRPRVHVLRTPVDRYRRKKVWQMELASQIQSRDRTGPHVSRFAVRFSVALISFAALGLELALIRWLALRFWHHFAFMAVSVALLGFGVSGVILSLCQSWVRRRFREVLLGAGALFAAAVPLILWSTHVVPLDVQFLPWNLTRETAHVLLLELLLLVPFLFVGAVVCIALMDESDRVSGHYAANLVGSGAGALGILLLMHWFTVGTLIAAMAVLGLVAIVPLVRWRMRREALVFACIAVFVLVNLWVAPREAPLSQYKTLPQLLRMPEVTRLYSDDGPLGQLDVVAGPSLHFAPGLSLAYTDPIPEHALLIIDGDHASPVYDVTARDDWRFLDYTTGALPYHLRPHQATAVIGAGGGAAIGLALYHRAERIAGLEMNPQVIAAMKGPLHGIGGRVYESGPVEILNAEARGYFARDPGLYDVIQLPAAGTFGAAGAGLYAAQESYLYTVEAVGAMLDALSETGMLCVTVWMRRPPRDGPRMFNLLRAALEERGLPPREHMAMIRSWVTVSILASKSPFSEDETAAIRHFCRERSFDVCHLPGIRPEEANRFHILETASYYEMASDLLDAARREELLDNYLFRLNAPTDDRPFFFHFFRWRALPVLREQLGMQSRAYLETGYLMVIGAVVQIGLLSVVLILLPLVRSRGAVGSVREAAPALAYFLCLGIGFMFLEMGFLQKLILYLAHPIYSAAVVVSGFLVFGGIGSQISGLWPGTARARIRAAAASVCGIGLAYLLLLDRILAATQGLGMPYRFALAAALIAPLAMAMGHMLPSGVRHLGAVLPGVIPWAWAVNGCASVVAAASVSVLAMQFGFSTVIAAAVICYAAAAALSWVRPYSTVSTRNTAEHRKN